jgi:hypothetical protein
LQTAGEFVASYLQPLAVSDLLAEGICENTTVMAVGRHDVLKGELTGRPERADRPFQVLVRDAAGQERVDEAHVVIDATGTFGNPNWLGPGGIPAAGEPGARSHLEYGLPDILGAERGEYAGRHVLVVGAGYSAATNIISLAELAKQSPQTRISWVTRGAPSANGPIAPIDQDRLPERQRIAVQANALAAGQSPHVTHWPGTWVRAVECVGEQFIVKLGGEHAGEIEVDRVLANVGFRPDTSLYAELQVHECYATSGPIKLAAALVGSSADCLDQISVGPQVLMNPEPNFYILGAKSYGRNSKFLLRLGLEQVRDVFTLIVGRADLDLYRTVCPRRIAVASS